MERGLAPEFALVVGEEGAEVDGGDGIDEEVDQVIFGEPVLGRGREEGGLIGGPVSIGLVHAAVSPSLESWTTGRGIISNRNEKRQYSDRLLVPQLGNEVS